MRRWRIAPITAIVTAAMSGLNLALLGLITIRALPDHEAITTPSTWETGLSSIARATGRKPAETYAQILAHPVFFKSRVPFVPPPPPPPSSPKNPAVAAVIDPGLFVEGVMIKTGLSRAFLLSKSGMNGAWVAEGEIFQGWQVKSIDGGGVKLEQGGRPLELQLYPK